MLVHPIISNMHYNGIIVSPCLLKLCANMSGKTCVCLYRLIMSTTIQNKNLHVFIVKKLTRNAKLKLNILWVIY